jgi:hypothetical protein
MRKKQEMGSGFYLRDLSFSFGFEFFIQVYNPNSSNSNLYLNLLGLLKFSLKQ